MKTGICLMSCIPVRKEATHRSEMVSQLLFGDMYEVSETINSWTKIMTIEDNYPGWIDSVQVYLPAEEEANRLLTAKKYYTTGLIGELLCLNSNTVKLLSIGSVLFDGHEFSIGNFAFRFSGDSGRFDGYNSLSNAIAFAGKCINAPYLWGGKTVFGFDCSGFIQIIYRMCGILLPRDASQQGETGELIPLQNKLPGDLAFFGDERITHVGIVSGRDEIIHCSGSVRSDILTPDGIYNAGERMITHKLQFLKRIFSY